MSALDDANNADAALVSAVGSPRRVHGDAGSVESHSIPDLIAASQYLAAVAATRLKRRGLRFNHLSPGGMVGRRAGELGGGNGNDGGFGIVGGFPG